MGGWTWGFPAQDGCGRWIIARATQLLDSQDPVVRLFAHSQLEQHISKGLGSSCVEPLPLSDFLYASTRGGLYDTRFYKCGPNTKSRARRVARSLNVRIDVSGLESSAQVVADEISCSSAKAARGLHSAIQSLRTASLASAPHQGRVVQGILLNSFNDMVRLKSRQTSLSSDEWKLIHQSRLGILPLLGAPDIAPSDQRCHRCKEDVEKTAHVTSYCRVNLPSIGRYHEEVLEEIVGTIRKAGHVIHVNQVIRDSFLRPSSPPPRHLP